MYFPEDVSEEATKESLATFRETWEKTESSQESVDSMASRLREKGLNIRVDSTV
jgi:hypothetical protein